MPAGFHRLIAAQFFSALADNALLIVTMALLQRRGLPAWWAPLLKFGFTLSYVVLAPLVGPLADAVPKAKLMAWMNGVKVLGVLALLAGANPVAAFVVVGFGAAAYAPAKYGLVTELVAPRQLVAANGWLEVSVVCAVLLGTVFGGVLVSPLLAPLWQHGLADLHLLLAVYGLAALLNLGVPDSGARYAARSIHPLALLRDFRDANATLWRDPLGGLSLAATTLFWGAGATLQFIVLRWAQEQIGLPLHQASYLQAAVAVGGGGRCGSGRALRRAGRRTPHAGLRRRARADAAGGGEHTQPVAGGAAAGGGRCGRRADGGAAERAAAAPRLRAADRRPLDRGAGLQRERQHPGDARRLCGTGRRRVADRAADVRFRPGARAGDRRADAPLASVCCHG